MGSTDATRPVTDKVNEPREVGLAGELDSLPREPQNKMQGRLSKWRDKYEVHPAAEVFPMMSDEDLRVLGEDIKANGLKQPIIVWDDDDGRTFLIDGRNRLEAMARAGIEVGRCDQRLNLDDDPVSAIIGLNIHRRHLTKQQQADLIVTVHKAAAEAEDKPRQVGEVSSKGGRGKVDKVKAAAVATAKEHGISKRTVERSIANAEGRIPESKKIAGPKLRTKPNLELHVGIDAARRYYLDRCAEPDIDLDAEQEIIIDALREIAGRREITTQATRDDLDLPEFLDRRRRP